LNHSRFSNSEHLSIYSHYKLF